MIDNAFAGKFADEWIEAWNSHDLDRILSHYSEDFEFTSPLIARVAGEPSCRLKGQPAIRAYWSKALTLRPDLHFELITVYAGVASVVIHYRRHDGSQAAEHFEFGTDGKVIRSSAHYVQAKL